MVAAGERSGELATLLGQVAARTRRYDFTVWFWGDAIAFDGLLDAADLAGDDASRAFCLDYLDRWAHRAPAWTDYLAPGHALLRLAQGAGRDDLLQRAVALARWYEEEVPRGPGGVHYFRPDLPQFRTTVLIDSMYHVPPFLARLGTITGDGALHDAALDCWFSHAEALDDRDGPILCHNVDAGSGRFRGYGWGRGNGWALYGLLLTLEDIPDGHPRRAAAVERLREMAAAIVALQDASGFWRTLLADPEAYLEASTAGFYGAVLHRGMRLGLLDREPFAASEAAAWNALLSRLDDEGGLMGVSAVTWAQNLPTEERALYKAMPTEVNVWGQGCALRYIAERLQGDEGGAS